MPFNCTKKILIENPYVNIQLLYWEDFERASGIWLHAEEFMRTCIEMKKK